MHHTSLPIDGTVERLAARSGPGDHPTEQVRYDQGPLFLMDRSSKPTARKHFLLMWAIHVL
jgi:hypothetical protein